MPQPKVSFGPSRSMMVMACAEFCFFMRRAKYRPAGPPPMMLIFISRHLRPLGWVLLIQPLDDHAAQTHDGLVNLDEGSIQRREAEADVIRVAEVGDDAHVFDEGEVNAQALGMAE